MHTRTTRQVIADHVRRRAEGDLDGDLRENYHPNVAILWCDEVLHGHDGVRRLARLQSRYHGDGTFHCHRLLTNDEMAVLEWSGLGGRTDTLTLEGTETFVVRDGLIIGQAVHYSGAFLSAA
jgi:hypothetical protein